jgi:gliding motility-associated-like protein
MNKKLFLAIIFLWFAIQPQAQLCTAPGQTPVSAILVCGTESFYQTTPSFCGQTNIPVACPNNTTYQNTNPTWFRFGCHGAGTLGFSIIPDEATANYNWQLFDVTNTNPEDVFTNASLFVACNWSSEIGETGASVDGLELTVCAGAGQALFSKMPNLLQGHTYLLMVANQSGSNAGYQLIFSGGTASITDAVEPHLQAARMSCDGSHVVVRLNKQLRCTTLAPDGSDFGISNGAVITAAIPGDCNSPFGTDSVLLMLASPLGNGNYTITINNGSDGNTMIDACNRTIVSGESIPLSVAPVQPTPLDSIFPVGCKPVLLEIILRKPVRCNSLARDGSDFILTGPQAVTITGVLNDCATADLTSIIRVSLSAAITTGGNYTLTLASGTDGNTMIDECGLVSPAGSSARFIAADTVSAAFTYRIIASCKNNTVAFNHSTASQVNSWSWDFGNGGTSPLAHPVVIFNSFDRQTIQLTVQNGICKNVGVQTIQLNEQMSAAFEAPGVICPGDPARFTSKSTGSIDFWQWNFGNGNTSAMATPAVQYFQAANGERLYTIQLIIGNSSMNCSDTVTRVVRVPASCTIAVPSAFTPNNDGVNDYLYPINGFKAKALDFKIFDRYGQLLFATKDWTKKWDGCVEGKPVGTGVYVWLLSFVQEDTGKRVFMKGTTVLLR